MAILEKPIDAANPFSALIGDDLAPAGTFLATVLDVVDEFGVRRQKYQSTETEILDQTCFLLGFRDSQGNPHRVASRRMRISGHEKSRLFQFLKSLMGRAPQYGWDYCELKGAQCLLTVEHVQRRDGGGVFAAIASLSPVPPGYGSTAPAPPGAGAATEGTMPAAPAAVPVAPSVAPVTPLVSQTPGPAPTDDEIPF